MSARLKGVSLKHLLGGNAQGRRSRWPAAPVTKASLFARRGSRWCHRRVVSRSWSCSTRTSSTQIKPCGRPPRARLARVSNPSFESTSIFQLVIRRKQTCTTREAACQPSSRASPQLQLSNETAARLQPRPSPRPRDHPEHPRTNVHAAFAAAAAPPCCCCCCCCNACSSNPNAFAMLNSK